MVAEKYGIFPIQGYWMSCDFREYTGHSGIDIGWHESADCYADIWAWKSGVVQCNVYDASLRGNVISLRHDYADGTCQYTQYLHMKNRSPLAVGTEVKQGDVIGTRGGTPNYGVHLHFTLTKITTDKTWGVQTIANNAIDPKEYLYKSPDKKYDFEYNHKPCDDKSTSGAYRDLRWVKDMVPSTVARDTTKHQYEVTIKDLYWRAGAGKTYATKGFVPVGIYNILETKENGGWIWNKVDEGYWFAGAYNGNDTHGIDYPIETADDTKIKELQEENKKLKEQLEIANNKLNEISKILG